MNRYIHNIQVNKIFHLGDFNIPIEQDNCPHLIITGKNGSGKTSLLNAIADFIEIVRWDSSKSYQELRDELIYWKKELAKNTVLDHKIYVEALEEDIEEIFGKVELSFTSIDDIIEQSNTGDFVVALYRANRKVQINEPTNPTKPNLKDTWKTQEIATNQFLYFLSDLKIQEALARNEGLVADADEIRQWFVGFEGLLQQIFQDKGLSLEFNYKDYSFHIQSEGKTFKFTEMSDGFAAVLDIVVDLILKMQSKGTLARAYEKRGIVLIDEIETHLHLELQKLIMPLLTKVFPNIQFIVTTHSPFVLSSVGNAVAFDLEHREVITELNEYSYEALAEGYFGVSTSSSYLERQLDRLQELLTFAEEQELSSVAQNQELLNLIQDFESVPEVVSPNIIGRYLDVKREHSELFSMFLNND